MLMCAIPQCSAQEKSLRSGSLHLVDVADDRPGSASTATKKKMIWLCASCSATHTVQSWREPGHQLRPNPHASKLLSFDDLLEAQTLPFRPRAVGSGRAPAHPPEPAPAHSQPNNSTHAAAHPTARPTLVA